jgi:hypothetical protein
MNSDDDGSAALVILDDVHLPKRPRLVQMFGSELGDVALKLPLICFAGQPDALDVAGFVEIWIVDPPMFSGAAFDVLLEPGDREETLGDGFFKLIEIKRPPKDEKPHDNHGIGRPVHTQPRRVYG